MKYTADHLEITASQHNTASFHGKLRLEEHGRNKWVLLTDYDYTTMVTGRPLKIRAKAGFVTDLASIPRLFHSVIPKVSRHRRAAIPHDVLYYFAGRHPLKRAECDKIFLEAMAEAGVRYTRRMAMYTAVRVGGWAPWSAALKRNGVKK